MIGIQHNKPALILAPMEGVTDAPMRALLAERGGFNLCVSEFLRISGNVPSRRALLRHVPELTKGPNKVEGVTSSGVPVQVQLLGGHGERIAQAAQLATDLGSPGIDLNFGCPAPTVNRHDGGAALLLYPERIREIVRAVRQAVPSHLPVSAKLRLGYESMTDIYTNALMAQEGGASWITIHARTKTQGYRPPAFWEYIAETKRRVTIPVVANGDIWDIDGFRRCREITGCEHFMIGRGVLANPSLPLQIARELGLVASAIVDSATVEDIDWSSAQAWQSIFQRFSTHCEAYAHNQYYNLARLKQWIGMAAYRRELLWFQSLRKAQSLDGFFAVLASFSATS